MPCRGEKTGRKIFADDAPGAFSVDEFCDAFRISVPMFYKLRSLGLGPDTFLCGNRRLISYEAAGVWHRARERATREAEAAAS